MIQQSAIRNPQSAIAKLSVQMIISGVGGQGVLLVTRVFSEVALQEGYPLIGSEDHGMSQRGGSVLTHIKIGDFDGPLVKKGGADILLSLEKDEAYKTLYYLRPATGERRGGLCFVNAPDPDYMDPRIKTHLEGQGIGVYVFGADQVAKEMGSLQATNIALIGFASGHPDFPFSHEKVRAAMERVTAQRFRDLSLKIFDRGLLEGRKIFKP
jgi:indolepyruvate ferredoxin oxidoreductase, beta subunit